MKLFFTLILVFPLYLGAQIDRGYEVGLEFGNFSLSTQFSMVDMAVKFAVVEEDELAYGPIVRTKFFKSNNTFSGVQSSGTFIGLGAFLHYRLLEWFYLGTEIEYNQNHRPIIEPQKRWNLAGFIGGGIHRKLGESNFHLNAGIMFDVIDAIRDPLTTNPSNFSDYYFLRRSNPQNPQAGGQYVPMVYRITFLYRLPI